MYASRAHSPGSPATIRLPPCRPDGGIGRREGLKSPCPSGRAGSSPAPGTGLSECSCRSEGGRRPGTLAESVQKSQLVTTWGENIAGLVQHTHRDPRRGRGVAHNPLVGDRAGKADQTTPRAAPPSSPSSAEDECRHRAVPWEWLQLDSERHPGREPWQARCIPDALLGHQLHSPLQLEVLATELRGIKGRAVYERALSWEAKGGWVSGVTLPPGTPVGLNLVVVVERDALPPGPKRARMVVLDHLGQHHRSPRVEFQDANHAAPGPGSDVGPG